MTEKVKKEELRKMLDEKVDFLLFDVRQYASYLQKHIKGAKPLPVDEIEKEAPKLDRSKLIVVYCGGYTCPLSRYAAEKLSRLGFKVKAYEGGIAEWSEANLPVESG
ncbi:MAG: rhodanese-like domain-containing protein [Candidatus Woesearchaeota archaeon]